MPIVTNNRWLKIELNDSQMELLNKINSWEEINIKDFPLEWEFLIENWLCLWEIFWWKLLPLK